MMRMHASCLGFVAILVLAAGCSDDGGSDDGCETNADCSNGRFCDGEEVCNTDGTCGEGVPPTMDDGIACTVAVCQEATDDFRHMPDDSLCSDDLYCNGNEVCNPSAGCEAGTPPSDGFDCTDDVCDEETDSVTGTPNHANCDDGLFCNGYETCGAVGNEIACIPGTPAVVNDDGVGCTDDMCDEDLDMVVNRPNDANCDNALFCDGAEYCDPVVDCQDGPVPTDDVGCTDDVCDEDMDIIIPAPNDANCDNGMFCDGVETCDAINDCQAGTPVVADDGVGCTADSCDEINDVVVNLPNDGACDNGQFCDGAETCDAINDCQAGMPPVSDDGVGCTVDSCDETNDVVVNAPNDAACDDADICTTSDSCDPIEDCQYVTDAICAACGDTLYDNGPYDSVASLVTASGPWSEQGLIDDFTLTDPTSFCTIEFDFVVPPGSTQFKNVQISIYDLGGTGIAGLGDFGTTTPVFTQSYSESDGTLMITDTGDDITAGIANGDILRYEAVGTTQNLGAGNWGLFLTFPDAASDSGGWATAAPTGGASECMTGWGTTQLVPSPDACSIAGPAFENGAFRLLTAQMVAYDNSSAPALDLIDNDTVTDTVVSSLSATCEINDISVDIDINHTWLGDLTIDLEHVNTATSITLLDDDVNGAGNIDLVGMYTWVDDPASVGWDTISNPAPVSPGTTYLPDTGSLTDFVGLDASSDWLLSVNDDAGGDSGTLNSWRVYGICALP